MHTCVHTSTHAHGSGPLEYIEARGAPRLGSLLLGKGAFSVSGTRLLRTQAEHSSPGAPGCPRPPRAHEPLPSPGMWAGWQTQSSEWERPSQDPARLWPLPRGMPGSALSPHTGSSDSARSLPHLGLLARKHSCHMTQGGCVVLGLTREAPPARLLSPQDWRTLGQATGSTQDKGPRCGLENGVTTRGPAPGG